MRQISEMRRTISAVAATAALCVLALLTVACARPAETAAPSETDAAIGESGVLNGHTLQSEIDGRKLTLAQIVERGESLFTASFNALDGAGRPETTDVGVNNFRPPHTFPDNFNRISGPDANSCLGCHNQPRAGGAADNAANVFVLADRLHFVNFDYANEDMRRQRRWQHVFLTGERATSGEREYGERVSFDTELHGSPPHR